VPHTSFCGCNPIDLAEVTPNLHHRRPLDDEVLLHLAIIVDKVMLVNIFCPLPLALCEMACLQKASGLALLVAAGLLLGTSSCSHQLGSPTPASPLWAKSTLVFCPGCEQQFQALFLEAVLDAKKGTGQL